MYPRPKSGSVVPSDAQAKEKLALYVYEYLLHVGAQKAAATFLNEIRWDKNITLGESPGFLHSWWCVFWDLYCAAPERRDTNEHSTEAKVFHEYGFVPNTAGAGPGAPPPFAPPNGYIHNPQPGGLPPGPQDGPLAGGPPGFPFHPMTGQPMPGGPGGMANCIDARGPPGPQGPGAGSNQGPPANMIQHGGPPGPLGPGGMGHQRLTQTPPTQMAQMGPGRMLVNPGPPNGPPGGPGFGGPYGGGVNCSPLPPGASNMSPLPTGGPPGRGPGGGPSGQQYSSASPVTFAGPGTPGQGGPGMGPGSQDGEYMMRHGLPPGMQAGQGGPQQGGPGSMAFMGGPGGPDGGMMASEMGHILNGMEPQFESMKQSPRHPMMGGGPGSRGDDPGAMYPGMYSELQSMQSMQSMQALAGMQPPNAANGGQQQATVHHLN